MAKNEAERKVLEKVRDVEKEQGSFAEAGSESPPHYGHDSVKSACVAGNKMLIREIKLDVRFDKVLQQTLLSVGIVKIGMVAEGTAESDDVRV